ncbi:hypothetical protein [Aurantiacibacter gangjinensis]|uniref:hypothetical protein n=1 Tax=Aurantiacibacter gangjinensis TaxID=502682 RepID=UPI00090B6C52|nr:hypothetical protein [Aurantiacibacter gangjinensis]APE27310.1 hypothetical protein BMF35_a0481 [Aurantiacibacter gangjinensis]
MATSPEHIDGTARAKPPITASPAFPLVVGLWFAALFGIGSMIVPTVLLEQVVMATGLPSLIPQMAPPLGLTAKGLIALAGTVLGGLLGFVLAKRIAAPAKNVALVPPQRRAPLSAYEELDADQIGEADGGEPVAAEPAEPVRTGRRRALAIEEEEGHSDFLNVAPLPGASEIAADDHATLAGQQLEAEEQPAGQDDTFELEASAELTEEQELPAHEAPAHELVEAAPPEERQECIPIASVEPTTAVEAAQKDGEAAPVVEPLAFSPPSMARTDFDWGDMPPDTDSAHDGDETDEDDVIDKQTFDAPEAYPVTEDDYEEDMAFAPPLEGDDTSPRAEAMPAHDDDDDDDSGEGLVQLVQRLGSTLDKHREWSARMAAEKAARDAAEAEAERVSIAAEAESEKAPPVPQEFDAAEADDAAEAMAAYFGGSGVARHAEDAPAPTETDHAPDEAGRHYKPFDAKLLQVDDEEDEAEDDLSASFTLPLSANKAAIQQAAERPAFDVPTAVAAPAPEPEVDEDAGEEADSEADFASLNPFKQAASEFVRIDEPEDTSGAAQPAVLFPNQQARKPIAPQADAMRPFDAPAGPTDAADSSAAHRAPRPQPSNDDNERALREVLMNLQRMGK